jgi:hypothetical protein
MIEQVVERWHRYLKGEYPGGLDALLADDCVFYSPIVFTPQQGKEVTKMYLQAAGASLGGEDPPAGADSKKAGGKFRYTREILQGHDAMLEFESSVEGKYLNGIDIITCNDEGQITEFKVFVRPLQAINAVHRQMMATLEKMKG